MPRPRKFKKAEVVEALRRAHGLQTGAAELLGTSANTIGAYVQRYPECREVVEFWRVRRKDRAEYKLDEAIERGESWAVIFTLKNARDREYSERVEHTGTLNITNPDARALRAMPDDDLFSALATLRSALQQESNSNGASGADAGTRSD